MEQFVSYYEVIAETNDYCEGLEQQYVLEGTQEIEKRGNKCIELNVILLKHKINYTRKHIFSLQGHILLCI